MTKGIWLYMDDVRPCPPGWTLARTVDEAKLHLELGGVELASLDHDMGACADCRRSDEHAWLWLCCKHVPCGYDLVEWMIQTGKWPRQKPVVHSQNPVGAARMREAIERHWPQRQSDG